MNQASRVSGSSHWLWLSAVVIVLDQATKQWVTHNMALFEKIQLLPFFGFEYVHNRGAAFSFLAGASGWQRWFFIVLGVGVSVAIMIWLRRLPKGQLIWLSG